MLSYVDQAQIEFDKSDYYLVHLSLSHHPISIASEKFSLLKTILYLFNLHLN